MDAPDEPAPDVARDAPVDALDCSSPMTPGCSCSDPGATMCIGGMGIECCGGEWRQFWDGPCYPPPDGGIDCSARPTQPGCPCTTEGETACRTAAWTLRCTGGTWQPMIGRTCC